MNGAPQIRESLDEVLDARGAGLAEANILARLDTPELDSLAEAIAFADDIPKDRKRELLDYVGQAIELNQIEGNHERTAAQLLDELARAAHQQTCAGLNEAIGVLDLARQLRPHLAVIATPADHDGVAYFKACAGIRDITRHATPTRLAAASLRNQLGVGRHDLLLTLTGALA